MIEKSKKSRPFGALSPLPASDRDAGRSGSTNTDKRAGVRKGAKAPFVVQEHEILGGKAKVVRTRAAGQVWQIYAYVPGSNGRTFKRSLRTENFEEASELAHKEYFALQERLRHGENIFSPTAQELVDRYIADESKRVRPDGRHSNGITKGRLTTITTVLRRHFLKFVGADTRLDTIKPERFQEYFRFRQAKNSTVKLVTLRNERSAITKLFKYAVKARLVKPDFVPDFEKIYRPTQRAAREDARDAFTLQQWSTIHAYLEKWLEDIEDPKELYDRQLVRDFIFIKASSGLRFGEMRKLTWVMIHPSSKDNSVKIEVPPDTKTGAREAIGLSRTFFERVKSRSSHIDIHDYVFCAYESADQFPSKTLRKLWKIMMEETRLAKLNKKHTYYSLRHTYCTFQLLAGVSVNSLALNMGTGIEHIQKHYSHVTTELVRDELTKGTALSMPKKALDAQRAAISVLIDPSKLGPLNFYWESQKSDGRNFNVKLSSK